MQVKRITADEDLKKAFNIRKEVFVEEQGVLLEDEFDEFDRLNGPCQHILIYCNQQPVGTGRIRILDGLGKLERICVLKSLSQIWSWQSDYQCTGRNSKRNGLSQVKLHGQTQAEGFYQKLGYRTSSDVFMEDGIPHVLMLKNYLQNKDVGNHSSFLPFLLNLLQKSIEFIIMKKTI